MSSDCEELSSNDIISSLWSPTAVEKCRLGLADALVFENGNPARWYITGPSGEVKLKRNLDLKSLTKRWKTIQEQSQSPYIAVIKQEGKIYKYLTEEAWDAFLMDFKPDTTITSIHNYLGSGTIIHRNKYTMNLKSGRWRTNTFTYTLGRDDSVHIAIGERLMLIESKATQINKVLDLATTTIVRYVEKMLKVQFIECSIDYTIDRKSQIWMLWSDGAKFTRTNRPLSATLTKSPNEIEEDSYISMSDNGFENEEQGKQLGQQLMNIARSSTSRNDPRAAKIANVNIVHTFSDNPTKTQQTAQETLNNNTKSTKSHYPTPYQCAGDYCNLEINPSGQLTLDKKAASKHLMRKFFSDSEIDMLRKDVMFVKMTQFGSSGLSYNDINKRSVELARVEKRGLQEGLYNETQHQNSSTYNNMNYRSTSPSSSTLLPPIDQSRGSSPKRKRYQVSDYLQRISFVYFDN